MLLSNRAVFASSDLDEVRGEVAKVFCPHRLDLAGDADLLSARFNSVQLGSVRVSYLDYGAGVHIEPGDLDTFFLVMIPLAGRSLIRVGDKEIVSTSSLAALPSPTRHLDMRWAAGCPQLVVKFERTSIERSLEQMLGEQLDGPVVFDPGMDLTTGWTRSWRGMADLLVGEAERDDGLTGHPLAIAHLENALITLLLTMQPSNYLERLMAPRPPALPKVVRRAMEFVEGHAHLPLTTADIAGAVAISSRSLQEGFRAHLGLTPMALLRQVRLARVHDELRTADPARATVTTVAARWGFLHQGRFAAQYRERYGQPPSETLRRDSASGG
ncbi:AraC family transcriptional regulator [Nonomuraea angiospora]|uniref:AraC family transcriptional regulator n=1 Tax=Nonomuraea angiospora TaxID=46172 RepID=UPI0033C5A0CB